jgi:hypothetical protein
MFDGMLPHLLNTACRLSGAHTEYGGFCMTASTPRSSAGNASASRHILAAPSIGDSQSAISCGSRDGFRAFAGASVSASPVARQRRLRCQSDHAGPGPRRTDIKVNAAISAAAGLMSMPKTSALGNSNATARKKTPLPAAGSNQVIGASLSPMPRTMKCAASEGVKKTPRDFRPCLSSLTARPRRTSRLVAGDAGSSRYGSNPKSSLRLVHVRPCRDG